MRMTLAVHILAGSLGLIFGFVALFSAKGAVLHRKSGMLFVYAILTMAVLGMLISIGRGVVPAINIPAGLLTAYLAITALTTVRPSFTGSSSLHLALMLIALTIGITNLTFGIQALASVDRKYDGIPAFPFFMFGVVGTLAAAGDLRILRSGVLRGASRIARHLWRMCFALFIATLSAPQLTKLIPKPYRIPGMTAPLTLIVLAAMLYWLWRIRISSS